MCGACTVALDSNPLWKLPAITEAAPVSVMRQPERTCALMTVRFARSLPQARTSLGWAALLALKVRARNAVARSYAKRRDSFVPLIGNDRQVLRLLL